MFEKVVVVDCKDHLVGRVASIVAKQLLNGQKVVLVRTEDMNISGSLFRNKIKYQYWLNVRVNTNPKRGPFHYKSPARIMHRVIRGMIPHKTARGKAAMDRLKVFEGCPTPYDRVKKQVMPAALRNLRLKPGRKFCRLGDLSAMVGWKHNDLVNRLEAKRKVKAAAFYNTKKELIKVQNKAQEAAAKDLAPVNKQLAAFGY